MKIVGFAQLHNELERGNLRNWLRSMAVCDAVYVYDQASDDGSREEYRRHANLAVIESPVNNFRQEQRCKAILLDKLLADHPDADWIFWMDGDTLLDGRLDGELLRERLAGHGDADAVRLGHYNLWRSDVWFRVDSQFHSLHEKGVVALWRNNGRMKFAARSGLHGSQIPRRIRRTRSLGDYALVHRGFATDQQILWKHANYGAHGMRGWALDRILDETTLDVRRISDDVLPGWLAVTDDTDPRTKTPLRELANAQR